MKTQSLAIDALKPLTIPAKADIAVKVLMYVTILVCINLVAFM